MDGSIRGALAELRLNALVDFFCAAVEESAGLAERFRAGLGARIAADPQAAACRWHVALLDIARA